MAKINKFANLYDKDGNLIKKAPIKNVTIEELEQIIDTYEDKNSKAYAYMVYLLMDMYKKYGNPHEKEIMEKLKAAANKDVTTQQVAEALTQLEAELNNNETPENTQETLETEEVHSGDVGSGSGGGSDVSDDVKTYDVDSLATEDVEYVEE